MSFVSPNTPDISAMNGYNVKLYGLKGDGTTDDRAALNTLCNTTAPAGSIVFFPPGIYLIGSNIAIANKQLNFVGAGQASIIKITANTQIFNISSTVAAGAKCTFRNIYFQGSDVGGNQAALYFSDNSGGFVVDKCWFTDFAYCGIAVSGTETSDVLGGLITNSKFFSNNIGVDLSVGSRAEYVQIIGCDLYTNVKAIITNSGNNIISNCNITYNTTTGIESITGTNNGHGIISNCNINHNTTWGINIGATVLGFTISDCHIYENPIQIATTTGVQFVGGIIDVNGYTLTSNTALRFQNVAFDTSYANTISLTGTAPAYTDCYNLAGAMAIDADTFLASSVGSRITRGRIVSYGSANNRASVNQIIYGATTDAATAVELTTDGAAGSGATNRIAVPADTTLSIVLNVAVKQSGSANAKQMLRQAVITNNGGTTALSGTPVALGTDTGDAGLATVTCTITANDTNDCLKVEVNGVVGTNLRYTCYIVSAETLYV